MSSSTVIVPSNAVSLLLVISKELLFSFSFGPETRDAVLAAQRRFGLPETGIVNYDTWEAIYNQFIGIENTSLRDFERLPLTSALANQNNTRSRFLRSAEMTQYPGNPMSSGDRDAGRQEANR